MLLQLCLDSAHLLFLCFLSEIAFNFLCLCSISAGIWWGLSFYLLSSWGSNQFPWVCILCSICILKLSLGWKCYVYCQLETIVCSVVVFFFFIQGQEVVFIFYFSILSLVLIFSLPHNGLCALKSPSNIIGDGNFYSRPLISSSITWYDGVDILGILFFFFSQPIALPMLLPGRLFLCLVSCVLFLF